MGLNKLIIRINSWQSGLGLLHLCLHCWTHMPQTNISGYNVVDWSKRSKVWLSLNNLRSPPVKCKSKKEACVTWERHFCTVFMPPIMILTCDHRHFSSINKVFFLVQKRHRLEVNTSCTWAHTAQGKNMCKEPTFNLFMYEMAKTVFFSTLFLLMTSTDCLWQPEFAEN